jgi:hypothetical protein
LTLEDQKGVEEMKISRVALGSGLIIAIIMGSSNHVLAQDSAKPKMQCKERFATLDTDKDGKVNLEEFMAVKHPRGNAEEIFRSRDTDGDGALTEVEFCITKGMGRGLGRGRGK